MWTHLKGVLARLVGVGLFLQRLHEGFHVFGVLLGSSLHSQPDVTMICIDEGSKVEKAPNAACSLSCASWSMKVWCVGCFCSTLGAACRNRGSKVASCKTSRTCKQVQTQLGRLSWPFLDLPKICNKGLFQQHPKHTGFQL